jgi:hypothetical protein
VFQRKWPVWIQMAASLRACPFLSVAEPVE